jgi:hypothetical protein
VYGIRRWRSHVVRRSKEMAEHIVSISDHIEILYCTPHHSDDDVEVVVDDIRNEWARWLTHGWWMDA